MLRIDIGTDEIGAGERFRVSFYRTLRVPDDGKTYPLPPGLGKFPLFRVEDFGDRLPPEMREQGGVLVPVYQREALWLGFHAAPWKPNAVIVAIGRINAITGAVDDGALCADPQNYLVCPDQPWLDGIHTAHGAIRQFVAMPLGLGYTVEAALTQAETVGGIQLTVFEPKPGRFPDTAPARRDEGPQRLSGLGAGARMGLGAGGVIRQKIYPDSYGQDTWDAGNSGHVVVHLINSAQFREITGLAPPPTPVDAKAYTDHGFPWFDLYDEARGAVAPTGQFSSVTTIADRDDQRGQSDPHDPSFDVPESQVGTLQAGAPIGETSPANKAANRPSPRRFSKGETK